MQTHNELIKEFLSSPPTDKLMNLAHLEFALEMPKNTLHNAFSSVGRDIPKKYILPMAELLGCYGFDRFLFNRILSKAEALHAAAGKGAGNIESGILKELIDGIDAFYKAAGIDEASCLRASNQAYRKLFGEPLIPEANREMTDEEYSQWIEKNIH